MLKFTSAIKLVNNGLLRKIPNSDTFIVESEFIWYLDYKTKKEMVIVPRGFRTDFGSIPKSLRFFFNPINYIGYILHDYLYSRTAFISVGEYQGREFTRKEADMILLEALNVEGAGTIEKASIYFGVRIGGWLHFRK